MEKQVVIVSGAPGAGKTSVAVPLAAALSFPLVSKDMLKEAMWDAVAPSDGDLVWSRRIGAAAMEALWTLAASCDKVVLEANFRPEHAYERQRLKQLGGTIVEVNCVCPLDLAAERCRARGATSEHHAAHVRRTIAAADLAEYSGPLAVGPVVHVDTTKEVDITRLSSLVTSVLQPTS